MADTVGLLKTRGEWTDAVANGETALTHQEWYDQKYAAKEAAAAEAGYKKADAKMAAPKKKRALF